MPFDIKKEIHKNIMVAFGLRDEAYGLLGKANELLFKRLNLPPLKDLDVQYLTDDSDLRTFPLKVGDWQNRIDASFHVPIINKIVEQLETTPAELTNVGDKRVSEKIILPGRFGRVYVNQEYGVPFLSGGDILQLDPTQVKYLSIKRHDKRIQEQLTLHENMILITCSGTIGNTVLAPTHFDGWAANQHILRIVPSRETNVGYIYTFLASSYGRELIRRFTCGSVVDEIDDNQLASVEFPLPSQKIQDEIGDLALDAKKKYSDAYRIEKTTTSKLEEIILSSLITSIPESKPTFI